MYRAASQPNEPNSDLSLCLKFAQTKAFSLRRHPRVASLALKGNSPSGAHRADVVCGTNFENLMHLGEYAWIIAFGDEILRCKISHHISLAPLDSFSSSNH